MEPIKIVQKEGNGENSKVVVEHECPNELPLISLKNVRSRPWYPFTAQN